VCIFGMTPLESLFASLSLGPPSNFMFDVAGNYDQGLLYQSPSTEESLSEVFFKSKNSVSSHELVN